MQPQEQQGAAPSGAEEVAPNDSSFWKVEELAAYLRLSPKTVYEEIRANRIPGVKRFKRVIRIYIPAVLEWAAADSKQKRR